jgi:hypothetical protein
MSATSPELPHPTGSGLRRPRSTVWRLIRLLTPTSLAAPSRSLDAVRDESRTLVPARSRQRPSFEARELDGWITLHRVISLTATLGLLWPAFKAWNVIVSAPLPGLAAVALTGATLLLACLIAVASTEAALERLDRWLLVLGLLIIISWAGSSLEISSGYTTDEAAFVHGAANLLLHGHDPYGANLLRTLAGFGVPPMYWTYTMSGGLVSTLGYPALPVLVTLPFVALLGNGQAVTIAEVVVLLIATTATFAALPRAWRSLALVLCIGFPILEGFAVAGLNVVLMLPALIVVALRWTRVGEHGRLSARDHAAAIALGLVLSTNQLGWFVAPFVLVGIALLRHTDLGARHALNVVIRYGGVAALTFAVVNGPFIIWAPGAWLHGVTAPLGQHAIPYGQGLVGLTAVLGVGGGAIDAYTYGAAALYLGLLLLFATRFSMFGRACFLLPSVALYASSRSLAEYWLALVVPIVVGAVAVDAGSLRAASQLTWPRRMRLRLPRRIVLPGLFIPAIALLIVALLSPAPLSIHIQGEDLNPQRTAVVRLWVTVRNRSDARLKPHFAINSTGQATPFWRIVTGPATLPPRGSARYLLSPTELDPAATQPFLLQAVTGSPSTISSSSLFSPGVQLQMR